MDSETDYVDLLDQDTPIAGQKFVCISFVSPENILKEKKEFMYEEFLKFHEFDTSMKKFQQFLNFLSFKYHLDFDKMNEDFKDFVKSEKDALLKTNISDDFKTFSEMHEERLTREFNENYNFHTNTRGIKVRGCFDTQREAELKCKKLRELDPNHDIYVGPVGTWMPWEPDAYKTGKVEHLERELNELMSQKMDNEKKAKEHFDMRVHESKKKAIEDNKKKAEKTGNKLSQDVNEKGEFIEVNGIRRGVDIRQEFENTISKNETIDTIDE